MSGTIIQLLLRCRLELENNMFDKKYINQEDITNIEKMALIVGRRILWYNMYRFRESHPINTNK